MTLYFDYRVQVGDLTPGTSFVSVDWHQVHPLLAVSVFSPEKGGAVFICDDLGDKLRDIDPATHPTAQTTTLAWHPNRRTLVITWQNGEIRVWNGDSEYTLVQTTRQSVVSMAKWTQQGSKYLTLDSSGDVGAWRLDARGQLVPLFHSKPLSGLPVLFEPRVAASVNASLDIAGLAKKAVAGDERALDMFSAWRPKTAGRRTAIQADATSFYVATNTGCVYHVNETGTIKEVLNQMGVIQAMLHHEREDYLLIVVEGLHMNYYSIDHSGNLQEATKVKLSSSPAMTDCSVVWAGVGVLACAVGDTTVRIWEPSTGDSYSLVFTRSDQAPTTRESIHSLAFSKTKNLLCGCTNTGTVIIWKVNGRGYDAWTQIASTKLKQNIKEAAWGVSQLAINTVSTVYVLREHTLSAVYHRKILVVQTSATQMIISVGDDNVELSTDLEVTGIAFSEDVLAVWSGKAVAVYNLNPVSNINVIGSFTSDCVSAGIWDQNLIVLTASGRLDILTFQGTVKQNVETDSQPITLSLTGHFMTISTMTGILQVWDIGRREAKPFTKMKDLIEAINDFGEVISAVCNNNATKVALTVAGTNLTPLPAIFVWCIDDDTMYSHYFQIHSTTRFVIAMHWDVDEPRLLVCEARRPLSSSSAQRRYSALTRHSEAPTTLLVSFLSSQNHGMILKDSLPVDDDFVSLLGIDLPHFIVIRKTSQQKILGSKVIMKDFEGLEGCDTATKNAVINFSFSLSTGDLDQAFKAIRSIKSVAVWRSLAKMCVKGKRLDVAKVCLGHMGHTRGVAALKSVETEPELDAQVATLAVQLGMIHEAEELYKSCGRMDLLNKLYQMSDQWDKSIEIAQKHDRIHLKNTYHNFGKYLEAVKDTESAAHMYRKAETHRHEVPRMLLSDLPALEKYIVESKDSALLKWWAQFKEMKGDGKVAMKFYEEAGDYMSLVRMMCHGGDTERAAQIAETTGDPAACYYLAGRYESLGLLPTAVHFYTRATAYTNAIRLCKEQGLEDQLWALALSAGPREQAEAAKYLERISPDKAVLLYHKAGMFHKALDLAFRNNQYDAVELIATELTSETDKELLVKCSDYFIEQKHYEKAVHLLAIAKEYETAIKIAWEHNVLLNEDLAEKLSPEEGHPNRGQLLETLAECALSQANYHLSTKKYTQAGNKNKAMKALLKSGDTEKIIFFANVTRQKEMYVMAANYLQSLDWRVKPELLKTIISFYSKGKAPHLLASFYVACAQVEVDDFRNYQKALGALTEASKCLSAGGEQHAQLRDVISRKTALINKFLDASRMIERGEGHAGMQVCRNLLSGDSDIVRKGDIFALMIEHTVKNDDVTSAKMLLHELKLAQPSDSVEFYLTKDVLARLGIETEQSTDEHPTSDGEDGDVIDETV